MFDMLVEVRRLQSEELAIVRVLLRYGLRAHHLRPRTRGGTDEISNLAAVASVHHPVLIPNGPYALVGNPNLPDGLRMVHIDDLTPDEARHVGLPPRRAGPHAA